MVRNPKQEGSSMFDCRPQTGKCPMNCNQCFYNRPGAFYVPIDKPNVPTPEEILEMSENFGSGIVRMNCGHDSNLHRDLVIETAKQYKHFFFNTSIPRFDFPGPVVFTANAKEEESVLMPSSMDFPKEQKKYLDRIMFVRLRVSASNLRYIEKGIKGWAIKHGIPVVLTFMAYYEEDALDKVVKNIDAQTLRKFSIAGRDSYYTWKKRHINSYYCPTKEFTAYALKTMKKVGGRLVALCGSLDSNYCKDCRNCETYYLQTIKHLKEKG